MAGPWLYVISKRSGAKFDLIGESIDVTVENYWKLVDNERLREDLYWGGKHGISRHHKDVQEGDELFIYTGDKDSGIIGCAKINKADQDSNGYRYVVPEFDFVKCRALRDHPIHAQIVREWNVPLRPNLINLARFEEKLRSLLPW
jgi:hypothetical protein